MVLNERGILKSFNLVVYPPHLVVVIGDMKEEVHRLYKPDDPEYNAFLPPTEECPCKTYTVLDKEDEGFDILIWVNNLDSCKGHHFCHEVTHAALEIFKYVGATIDVENQEPFCYLTGNLYRLMAGTYDEYNDFLKAKDKKKSKKK